MKAPVASHPHQHLVLAVLAAMLAGGKCSLAEVVAHTPLTDGAYFSGVGGSFLSLLILSACSSLWPVVTGWSVLFVSIGRSSSYIFSKRLLKLIDICIENIFSHGLPFQFLRGPFS